MKNYIKKVVILLVLAIGVSACANDPVNEGKSDIEFCAYLTTEKINKTIPIVNAFLEELPDGISKEQTFESLVTWFNSFPCNLNAKILYRVDMIWGGEQMYGVSISVKENDTVREIELDFATINGSITYSRIEGYVYYKQDAIHVKTKYTDIKNVFDFINSLELDVKQIEDGTYLSSMEGNASTLEHILSNLKAKPYTTEAWVTGHLYWYNANLVIFLNLYEMKNSSYQADWLETMNKYKLENYKDGAEHIVVFYIPEGTGEQWEAYFMEYNFVHWAELSHTRYTIR